MSSSLPPPPDAPAAAATPLLGKCMRVLAEVLLPLIILFCSVLLVLRYWVMPDIDSHRERIETLLQRQIGQPVEIGRLQADWDGWNPQLNIKQLRVLDGTSHAVVLSLPEVRLTIGWTSLLLLDLRFKELLLERPQFALRRDAQGMLHVVGLTFDPNQPRDDAAAALWLLRQRRIVIHDASLTWLDEQRQAPLLALDHVEFRLESFFGRHRFGLTGRPPPEVAAPLDLRGDLTLSSALDWHSASGRLYARLDYADVAAWRQWLPLPAGIRSGKGALRLWFDFAKGEGQELVADVVLTDVQARLAPDLPELQLTRLEGRVGWRRDASQNTYFTDQLSFSAPGNLQVAPTDFKLTLRTDTKDHTSGGSLEFNSLQLGPLTQVAVNLPLPESWRGDLAHYAPRGTLEQGHLEWEGDATSPQSFGAKARFLDLGLAAYEWLPGVTGLTGSFEATQRGGSLRLQSRTLALAMPHLFADPLAFENTQARIDWTRDAGDYALSLEQLTFSNRDLAGSASGKFRTSRTGPGTIDLSAQLTRADVTQVYRYVPSSLPPVRDWLKHALVSGHATDTRLRLSGDLADFPFLNKRGQFLVTTKAQGLTFDYAEHWPAFSDVDADLRFEGVHMQVDARRGHVFAFNLQHAKAEIPDFRVAYPLLRIDGEASGQTADVLKYIGASPIGAWTGNFTAGAQVSGTGKLTLQLELPLGKPSGNKTTGEYTFSNNRLKLAGDIPTLNQLNGKLAFTNHDLSAQQMTAELLGGPARFSVESREGQVRIAAQGTADLAQLRTEYPTQLAARRLSGSSAWQATIINRQELSTWVLESSLKGVAIDLPAPMTKAAADSVPLQIERRASESAHDTIVVRYGNVGRLVLDRRLQDGHALIDRGLLALGGAQGEPDRPGLWVRGNVDVLDVDGWLALKRQSEASGLGEPLPLGGVDLGVRALDVFGRRFNELRLAATRNPNGWQLDLRGKELAGTARWLGAAAGRPNGELSARLQRFTPPSAAPVREAPSSEPRPSEGVSVANAWPDIDIVADTFVVKGRDLGRLELNAQPRGADWQIKRLQLANDDGKLEAQGWWRVTGRAQQTNLEATLDIVDAGRYLARFGLPGAVRGAPTRVKGELGWDGGPEAFDYPSLTGGFRLESGRGQFTKLDPGPAKLLGVLSLQSLGRRLTFENDDLFGEGFAFDEITADARIQRGVMSSNNLSITGPAANVMIRGETNIARETQQFKVHVQPKLSSSLSMGAAALLLANPIIGAAVGAGTLLAQKIMSDPIEQIFSVDYLIGGTWSDPTVEKLSKAPAASTSPEGAVR